MESGLKVAKPIRLAGEVYQLLLKRLLSLEIRPGERISVDRLARDLGVSQTPIREALSQLEIQGLVVNVHLSGYRAAPQLTQKQFDDLCELRLLIEPAAAAKAAALMTPDVLNDIVALAGRMKALSPGDPPSAYNAFVQDDAAFHAAIAKASGNELYDNILTQQRVHVHMFRLRYYVPLTERPVVEHAEIIEALRSKSPERAGEAMRSHIANSTARFRTVFD